MLCASYDGFDETEDSTFPNMLIETAKLENYIQKNLAVSSLRHMAVLWAAPLWDLWCSAKKSISDTESSEAPIWIRQQLWNLGDGESYDASSWKNASQRKASSLGKKKMEEKPVRVCAGNAAAVRVQCRHAGAAFHGICVQYEHFQPVLFRYGDAAGR
mgnify:CR=1 FL=1